MVFGYLPICRTAAEPCGWHQWWCRCCWPRASWPGGNISEALWKYVAIRVLINDSTATDVINYPLKDRPGHQTIFISVLMEAKQRQEEKLTYAQFPISFANIFSGMVLGSSFSFPSVIRLSVEEKQRKEASDKIKRSFEYKILYNSICCKNITVLIIVDQILSFLSGHLIPINLHCDFPNSLWAGFYFNHLWSSRI